MLTQQQKEQSLDKSMSDQDGAPAGQPKIKIEPRDWQKLHVEYAGDRMSARLNGEELKAQHEYLATPKVRWWFAAGGDNVQIRNVRFSEGEPLDAAK